MDDSAFGKIPTFLNFYMLIQRSANKPETCNSIKLCPNDPKTVHTNISRERYGSRSSNNGTEGNQFRKYEAKKECDDLIYYNKVTVY